MLLIYLFTSFEAVMQQALHAAAEPASLNLALQIQLQLVHIAAQYNLLFSEPLLKTTQNPLVI